VQKAKEVHKKWKDERQAALDADPPREPPPMPIDAIDPGNFIEPRLYATDPTIERLAALLVARPRGMMLIRDELTGLFANMGRYSGGSDRPFWLEAWNGGRHVVERVGGSIVVDHLLVGVVGSFQPDKLARAFAGDEDGMYGRFLYAWPLTPDYRPLTNEAAEVEPELQSALTALIRLPSEDVGGVFIQQSVWLSGGAIAEFEKFRLSVDLTKRPSMATSGSGSSRARLRYCASLALWLIWPGLSGWASPHRMASMELPAPWSRKLSMSNLWSRQSGFGASFFGHMHGQLCDRLA